jgi:hypothetical protein
MKLEKFTNRRMSTGEFFPRCQAVDDGTQCDRSTYANGLCWNHFAPKVPPVPIKGRESSNDGSNK